MANSKSKASKQTAQPVAAQPSTSTNWAPGMPVGAIAGFTVSTTLACGTPVTLAHSKRRMYNVVNKAGKVLGYICAKTPVNAINRVNANTLQTLKLH